MQKADAKQKKFEIVMGNPIKLFKEQGEIRKRIESTPEWQMIHNSPDVKRLHGIINGQIVGYFIILGIVIGIGFLNNVWTP